MDTCWESGPAVAVGHGRLNGRLGLGRTTKEPAAHAAHRTTPAYSQLGPHVQAGSCRLLRLSQQKGPRSKQGLTATHWIVLQCPHLSTASGFAGSRCDASWPVAKAVLLLTM